MGGVLGGGAVLYDDVLSRRFAMLVQNPCVLQYFMTILLTYRKIKCSKTHGFLTLRLSDVEK